MPETLPSPDTVLDGRTFRQYARSGAEITLRATEDDMSWALMHLGQYVQGIRAGISIMAYVYSVNSSVGQSTITVLITGRPA